MSIKKGDKFICLTTVIMKTGILAYKAGYIYESEQDDCITDERGNKAHFWFTPNVNFRKVTSDSKITYIETPDKNTSLQSTMDLLYTISDCVDTIIDIERNK